MEIQNFQKRRFSEKKNVDHSSSTGITSSGFLTGAIGMSMGMDFACVFPAVSGSFRSNNAAKFPAPGLPSLVCF